VSNLVAGSIVVAAGYHAAFLSLGVLVGAGFVLYLTAMPETAPANKAPAAQRARASGATDQST
jgi:hypothetical protein